MIFDYNIIQNIYESNKYEKNYDITISKKSSSDETSGIENLALEII